MPVLSSILVDTDEHGFKRSETFRSEGGTDFQIKPTASGLYEIVASSGGPRPVVCNSLYTGHLKARQALIEYINSTDRLGFAEHPEKVARKPKRITNESSIDE